MKLYNTDNILVFKTKLKGDIQYIQFWDIDYLGSSKPERIIEFIRIGKGEAYPLLRPLLIIKIPKINGLYDKRELGNFINDEINKKRAYLKRIGEKLSMQINKYVLNGEITYYNNKGFINEKFIWIKIPKKYKFLTDFFFGEEPSGDEEDIKIPP